MNKEQREKRLIEIYQKWIYPQIKSPNFPYLSEEDILKKRKKQEYEELYKNEKNEHLNLSKEDFLKFFEKKYGKKPVSLISKEGWFLISNQKEKDVSNIHYSFGFEDDKESEYWMEIALNSVNSVEQFLAMSDSEIKGLFKLCKTKPPRMILKLDEKKKKNHAGTTKHTTLFQKELCRLKEQDLNMIRIKANEINNLKNPLDKPFIGICVVNYLKKEDLAENFSESEDIFEFLNSITPRNQKYKNELKLLQSLEKRQQEIKEKLPLLKKDAIFWKSLGKYSDQEKAEQEIIKLEEEREDIEKMIKNKKETISSIEKDMNLSKNE